MDIVRHSREREGERERLRVLALLGTVYRVRWRLSPFRVQITQTSVCTVRVSYLNIRLQYSMYVQYDRLSRSSAVPTGTTLPPCPLPSPPLVSYYPSRGYVSLIHWLRVTYTCPNDILKIFTKNNKDHLVDLFYSISNQ